jgi:HPr kinase/phosphorylase
VQDTRKRLGILQTTGGNGQENTVGFVGVQRFRINETNRLSPINSRAILILSPSAISVLSHGSFSIRKKEFETIFAMGTPCIILSQTPCIPEYMFYFSRIHHVPVLASSYDEFLLESRLIQVLREKIEEVVMMHGALVNVNGVGVIITGKSGTGKTICAMRLAMEGHFWIADDFIKIEKKKGQVLYGSSHDTVKDLIYIKDVGVMSARCLLREAAICEETVVNIMVNFDRADSRAWMRRDNPFHTVCHIMSVALPGASFSGFPHEEKSAEFVERITRNFTHGGSVQ